MYSLESEGDASGHIYASTSRQAAQRAAERTRRVDAVVSLQRELVIAMVIAECDR
jgi:hypothetical protein